MYMKWDNALNIRWNGDERAIGKVNLKMGIIAVILFAGFVGILVFCSYGLGWWALGWGIGAALLLILAAAGIKRSFLMDRGGESVYNI